MRFAIKLCAVMASWLIAGSAMAIDVDLKRNVSSAPAYAQDRDGQPIATLTKDQFPLRMLEESPDGGRFRVKFNGRDVWLSKDEVKSSSPIDAGRMCSTALASNKNAATRNANEGCATTTASTMGGATRK